MTPCPSLDSSGGRARIAARLATAAVITASGACGRAECEPAPDAVCVADDGAEWYLEFDEEIRFAAAGTNTYFLNGARNVGSKASDLEYVVPPGRYPIGTRHGLPITALLDGRPTGVTVELGPNGFDGGETVSWGYLEWRHSSGNASTAPDPAREGLVLFSTPQRYLTYSELGVTGLPPSLESFRPGLSIVMNAADPGWTTSTHTFRFSDPLGPRHTTFGAPYTQAGMDSGAQPGRWRVEVRSALGNLELDLRRPGWYGQLTRGVQGSFAGVDFTGAPPGRVLVSKYELLGSGYFDHPVVITLRLPRPREDGACKVVIRPDIERYDAMGIDVPTTDPAYVAEWLDCTLDGVPQPVEFLGEVDDVTITMLVPDPNLD
jgi:hypothetical protein